MHPLLVTVVSLGSLTPAGTVQQYLQSLFLSAAGRTGRCSAGRVEGPVEGDGFPVLCRVYVAPENRAVSSTSVHQLARTGAPIRLTSIGGTGYAERTAGFMCSSNPRVRSTSQEGFAELCYASVALDSSKLLWPPVHQLCSVPRVAWGCLIVKTFWCQGPLHTLQCNVIPG